MSAHRDIDKAKCLNKGLVVFDKEMVPIGNHHPVAFERRAIRAIENENGDNGKRREAGKPVE